MSLRVNFNILNQKGTPAFYSDVFANRPAASFAGRIFISTDTGAIYEDTGSAWTLIADAGAGTTGTLQQVTTNGNTTTQGLVVTAGNVAIGTATAGAPLDIHSTGTIAQFNGTGTNNTYVFFQNAGASKWRLGNNYNAGQNSFDFYSFNAASIAASFNGNGSLLLNFNLGIKNSTGINQVSGYSNIAADSGGFYFNNGGANNGYFSFAGLTASRTFTLPDANGTLATTANLSSYLPLAGGNITGNLGINNASPAIKLSVVAPDNTNSSMASFAAANLTQQVELWYGGIRMGGTAAAADLNLEGKGVANMLFSTNSAERARITSGGQVLIGSTSSLYPNVKLAVKQTSANITSEIWSSYASDSGNAALMLIKNDNVSSSSQVFQRFVIDNGNTANGQINGNGASQVAFGSWSDIRLKENITVLSNQLNNILSLKPCEFDYKDGSGHQIGFIAQEIMQVYPEAVSENNKGYLTVTGWNKTEAILVKAIQELNEKLVRNNIN